MKDQRDQRDPQKLGETLLRVAPIYRTNGTLDAAAPLSVVADYAAGTLQSHVPDYHEQYDEDSTVYISELRERAAAGDKSAESMLAHFKEHGTIIGAPTEPVE